MAIRSITIFGEKMKIKRRQAKILEIIRKEERASVEYLAVKLDISRETIRRDLTDLAKVDKVQKIHGGATLPQHFGEASFQQRMSDNAFEKAKIASKALQFFTSGETIFIDTGSTTLYFAEKLSEISGLTIVTNSTELARIISSSNSDNQVFLLGGEFSSDNRQTVGTMAISQIRQFRAHHAVLTVGALDGRTGAMDYNIEEAQIASAMIEQSQSLTVLMDSSKYDQLASFEVCSLEKIDRLICDKLPTDKLLEFLQVADVDVILA